MNDNALLALIADLYAQLRAAMEEIARLRAVIQSQAEEAPPAST